MKLSVFFIYALVITGSLSGNEWAFKTMPGGHQGKINAIIHRGDTVISGGEDGFLETWDTRSNAAVQRFQISPYSIVAMAGRPDKDELCVIESNRFGVFRLSAWNYKERRNLFTLSFDDPVSHVSYSMGGSFIIAAVTGRTGLILIDPASGKQIQSHLPITANVSMAVTGRAERNLMMYLASGAISYWDIGTLSESHRFEAPASLSSPVLFSNNRLLAGINNQGLLIVNAASGGILVNDTSIPRNAMLACAENDLICFIQNKKENITIVNYSVDSSGKLIKGTPAELSFPENQDDFNVNAICAFNNGSTIIMGGTNGIVSLVKGGGRINPLAVKKHAFIADAAVLHDEIIFIADNGTMGIIPLDYNNLTSNKTVFSEHNLNAYNRITVLSGAKNLNSHFILWQDRNSRNAPLLCSFENEENQKTEISNFRLRSSLRSVVSYDGKILFLDSSGNISVIDPSDAAKRPFTYSSVGLLDAAFIDSDHLLLGRSSTSGSSSFLSLNISTGETVMVPFPSRAGVALFRGSSSSLYAASISHPSDRAGSEIFAGEADGKITSIIKIVPSNITSSNIITHFYGEETFVSFAEINSSLAVTTGSEEGIIFSGSGIQKMEQSYGFPLRLIANGQYFLCLDREGIISWHDSRSGKLLAIFMLYPDAWSLFTERNTISGR